MEGLVLRSNVIFRLILVKLKGYDLSPFIYFLVTST